MNTGELIMSAHISGKSYTKTWEPVIWCDICGYGTGGWDDVFDQYHFCHRHKPEEIRRFMNGSLIGYFQLEAQQDLEL